MLQAGHPRRSGSERKSASMPAAASQNPADAIERVKCGLDVGIDNANQGGHHQNRDGAGGPQTEPIELLIFSNLPMFCTKSCKQRKTRQPAIRSSAWELETMKRSAQI